MQTYRIKWDSQSKNSSDSMPVGGYNIGTNVWVEDNDLLLYMQQSGWFDENNSMLKFGRLRIQFTPNVFAESFSQELIYEDGYIQIKGDGIDIRVWVDANAPLVHVEGNSETEVSVKVIYESWRSKDRIVPSKSYELFQCKEVYLSPYEDATFYKDSILCEEEGMTIYHANDNSKLSIYKLIENQQLDCLNDTLYNPQENLISGGKLYLKNMHYVDKVEGTYLDTPYEGYVYEMDKPSTSFGIHAILHSDKFDTVANWKEKIEEIAATSLVDLEKQFESTKQWWHDFYAKSYIHIGETKDETLEQVGINYNLFQYMLASNYEGYWPTKFNGGLFTFDPGFTGYVEWYDGRLSYTPDYRLWGGGAHTIQNQRLVYWPMFRTGDAKVTKQQFDMMNRALVNAKKRTKHCFGCEGAVFPEQMGTYGLSNNEDNGWDNTTGWPAKQHIRYLFTNSLEISQMMIKYHLYTGESIAEYKEFIHSILEFYNDFYCKNDYRGKMILYPAGCMETYADAKNPVDAVSGLLCVLKLLLSLDQPYITAEDKVWYETLIKRIPDIQFKVENGKEIIAYADSKGILSNCELPETYPIFPFDEFGLDREKLEIAKNTIDIAQRTEEQKSHVSWHTTGVEYTRCGMVPEATDFLKKKMGNGSHRFPAFWGPGHDWTPDFNWGGSGCLQLQEMLVQEYAGNIYLLPCWPENQPVSFKLYCEGNGTIECEYDGKEITKLVTVPEDLKERIVRNN